MWRKKIRAGLIFCLCGFSHLVGEECLFESTPLTIIVNPSATYTLINSVDFHPHQNQFCVTYTQTNEVIIYDIVDDQPKVFQILKNPSAKLREPQHAVFSPDGEKMAVANWTDQTLNLYQRGKGGYFLKTSTNMSKPSVLGTCRPHGVTFSPCGNYLAIAYGVTNDFDRAIALYRLTENSNQGFELISFLKNDLVPGIPKGITFSPDGNCLLVTFCDINSLMIYNIDQKNHTIEVTPRQIIQGQETNIFRPEDVKISPDGNLCAVSNSETHSVTFYSFDKIKNLFTQNTPVYTLENPDAQFIFPHGIAFSYDGTFFAVTQFGPVIVHENGGIYWNEKILPTDSGVNLYKAHFF